MAVSPPSSPPQVDHLFLLVGENPLPNAIAILMLLAAKGIAYFIHTDRTRPQAQRLTEVLEMLGQSQTAQTIDLGPAHAEPQNIRNQIQAKAQSLTGSIGLNYTGGTKVMAVHSYRALETLHPNAQFSYLDPNTQTLIIDNDQDLRHTHKIIGQLSFEQLFGLHGLTWENDRAPQTQPIHPQAAIALASHCSNLTLANNWRNWCYNVLRENCTASTSDYWLSEERLSQLPNLPLQTLQSPLRQVLQQKLRAQGQQLSLTAAKNSGFTSLTQVCEWLGGLWLEAAVLHHIQQIQTPNNIHAAAMSFHIRKPDWQQTDPNKTEKFEFDVAFIRNYQLFALSCTTSRDRKLCKQKLIEASTRAKQLGGIEARIALVCGYMETDDLKAELEVEIRDRKIAVFGPREWPDLGKYLTDWIAQNA